MELTASQLGGIAAIVAALAAIWGPSVAAYFKKPAPDNSGDWDYDIDDVKALRTLEIRGIRLQSAKYDEGLGLVRRHFFDHDEADGDVHEE